MSYTIYNNLTIKELVQFVNHEFGGSEMVAELCARTLHLHEENETLLEEKELGIWDKGTEIDKVDVLDDLDEIYLQCDAVASKMHRIEQKVNRIKNILNK